MKSDRFFDPIKYYLDLLNHSVLKLHLCSIEYDIRTDRHYDNTQQNVDAIFLALEGQLHLCREALSDSFSEEDCRLICTILAIFSDEDILTSGLYPRQILWPKLQVAFIGNRDGGIAFYDLLDEALELSLFNKGVYEVFDYLLDKGFKGKHVGDLSQIKRYRQRLAVFLEKELVAER
jgi:type VI protein secretion system component VasF